MIAFLVSRILEGALTYEYVISRRPDLKDAIDKEMARRVK